MAEDSGTEAQWSGDDWQNYIVQLLRILYRDRPGMLQPVPSKSKGDLGIEAFSRDGCLFQCYAPEEPLSTNDRYEKQRNKLTTDLNKLHQNADDFARLLGDLLILHYFFCVPIFNDRRLITHATAKAGEVRSLGLPFIAPEFSISVRTAEDFPLERAELARGGLTPLLLPDVGVGDEVVDAWADENDPLVETLDAKLAQVVADQTARLELRQTILRDYLSGEELLDVLRNDHPDVWEKVARQKGLRESRLAYVTSLSTQGPNELLLSVLDEYEQQLCAEVVEIGGDGARVLAPATAADWLLRCPLRFQT